MTRPAKSINDLKVLVPGLRIFHSYLRFASITEFEIIKGPTSYRDRLIFDGEKFYEDSIKYSGLYDSFWFRVEDENGYVSWKSCSDCSVESDYNSNFLFLTREDAEEAIRNYVPNDEIYFPISKSLNPFFYSVF